MRADYQLVPWKEDVKKALKASGGDVLCLWHPGWPFPPYILDNRLVWQVLFKINFKLIPVVTLHIWSSSRLCLLNCQTSLHMFNPRNLKYIQTSEALEEQLGKSEFLVGNSVTLADIVLVFWTADRNITATLGALIEELIMAYILRFARWKKASRGSLIRTLGSPFLRRASGTWVALSREKSEDMPGSFFQLKHVKFPPLDWTRTAACTVSRCVRF